jgi:hypothetical protein
MATRLYDCGQSVWRFSADTNHAAEKISIIDVEIGLDVFQPAAIAMSQTWQLGFGHAWPHHATQ